MMSELEQKASDYESLAEWKVRRIPEPPKDPKETYEERMKGWVLSSIGVDGIAQALFLYLEKIEMATAEDLANHVGGSPEEVLKNVDALYTAGLIDRIGKAFYVKEPLSASIVRRLIPRITESLRKIAKMESGSRSDADYYLKMRGRAFSDVGEAVTACKEVSRLGGSPFARVVGTHGYTDESVEVEGPVLKYGHDPDHLVLISESGEKVVVGGRNDRGVDVKAHSITVRGENDE
jgi:hypothetical protein